MRNLRLLVARVTAIGSMLAAGLVSLLVFANPASATSMPSPGGGGSGAGLVPSVIVVHSSSSSGMGWVAVLLIAIGAALLAAVVTAMLEIRHFHHAVAAQ